MIDYYYHMTLLRLLNSVFRVQSSRVVAAPIVSGCFGYASFRVCTEEERNRAGCIIAFLIVFVSVLMSSSHGAIHGV